MFPLIFGIPPPPGMSYIAAVFLLYLDEYTSFVCLANLLNNNRTNMDFYSLNKPIISAYVKCFDCFFAQVLSSCRVCLRMDG